MEGDEARAGVPSRSRARHLVAPRAGSSYDDVVKRGVIAGLLVIGCMRLDALTCEVRPICADVKDYNAFFVGTFLDASEPHDGVMGPEKDFRFRVEQVFSGMDPDAKEATVTADALAFRPGNRYFIEATWGPGGHLRTSPCGFSGEISISQVADSIAFFRGRAKAKTSFTLRVMDSMFRMEGLDFTLSRSDETLTAKTDSDGFALFEDLQPGMYRFAPASDHYALDSGSTSRDEIAVLAGSCAVWPVFVRGDAVVSGVVRDSKDRPVGSMSLSMELTPEPNPNRSRPYIFATTDDNGAFRFEGAPPGKYYLVSNSHVARTYYPGTSDKTDAIPFVVEPGKSVENLRFRLPDFGSSREIRICVVDEDNQPVPSAKIENKSSIQRDGSDRANLTWDLVTDSTGCVGTQGYAQVSYSIRASILPPGASSEKLRVSRPTIIASGGDPVSLTLVIKTLAAWIPRTPNQ